MYNPYLKRLLDIIVSFLALIILSPVLVPIILLLLVTGEREVFYFQKRVGKGNNFFHVWKFATMVKNSPNIGAGIITLENDPRITKVGKFLRQSKLNELPQLINVLKGDMSIVGPRPLLQKSFKLYPENVQKLIYENKPGITGIGSLIFRDEERIVAQSENPQAMYESIFPYKGALELWYHKNISFLVDIQIIFLTAWLVLFPGSNMAYKVFRNLPKRDFN